MPLIHVYTKVEGTLAIQQMQQFEIEVWYFCRCRSPFKTGPLCASRLSKAGFDFRFHKLAKDTGNLHLITNLNTYADKKQAATAYFAARDRLIDFLKTFHFGAWLERPDELELFTMEH